MVEKISKIISEVLDSVLLTKQQEEALYSKVNDIIRLIENYAKELNYDISVELGGSSAKRTFLKGDFDCDVFVRFDYKKYASENSKISSYLKQILSKSKIKFNEVKGSRNYFQFKYKNIDFEIVPVLRINKITQAVNVTDASPFHVKWFKKTAKLKINNQIRISKLFCKAQKVYGAESFVKGFSGHVLDILTIKLGSFEKLIKFLSTLPSFTKLKKYDPRKIIVDINNFYKTKDTIKVLKQLNESKIDSPLIVIDPISPDRNAASALSVEKYNLLIKAAKDFLDSPNKSFFKVKPYSENDVDIWIKNFKERGFNTYAVIAKIIPLDGKKDVIGAKIMKLVEFITKQLIQKNFAIYDSGFEFNKKESFAWFIIDVEELDKYYKYAGPQTTSKNHVDNFKLKHDDTFIENNRIYATVKRDYTNAFKYIKKLIKSEYCIERCKAITISKR